MGDIADMMISGEICQYCGEGMPNPLGFPASCGACEKATEKTIERTRPIKSNCPICHRRIKTDGFQNHIKDAHPELSHGVYKAIHKHLREIK